MDLKKLRWYQLHKQNLVQQAAPENYADLLKDHIGLHSTDYLTPYLSLRARVKDFDPKRLFDDLNHPLNAIRMRAFRGTLFVIHRDNITTISAASKIFLAPIIKNFKNFLVKNGKDAEAIEKAVVELISNKNELTVNELKKELPDDMIGENFTYALRYLEFKGVLVRTNHRYITDRVIRYGLRDEWFPMIKMNETSAEESLKILVLNYIKKFGPVCVDDLSWWLSLTKTATKNLLAELSGHLSPIDFDGQNYFLEKNDYEKFETIEADDIRPPEVLFLPYEDHFTKAYKIRDWFLADNITPLVSKKGPIFLGQIFPTIWLNGRVIGGWQMNWVDKAKSAMKVEITDIHDEKNHSPKIRQAIEQQRGELEIFINERLVPLMKKT